MKKMSDGRKSKVYYTCPWGFYKGRVILDSWLGRRKVKVSNTVIQCVIGINTFIKRHI